MEIKTKRIKGFPKYLIDEFGNVYSYNGQGKYKDKLIKLNPIINHAGYPLISLSSVEYKDKKHLVHRLVAVAFVPNPENKPQVNHKDLNKMNNNASNLEWVTVGENIAHYNKNRKYNSESWEGHRNGISVAISMFTKDGKHIRDYECMSEAEKDGFHHSGISMCVNGKREFHCGYIWKRKKGSKKDQIRNELLKKIKNFKDVGKKNNPNNILISVYDMQGNHIRDFNSITSLKQLGFARACIAACINGKNEYHKGFKFKRKDG